MFVALKKAVCQINDPCIQKIVLLGAGVTVLVFIALWFVIAFILVRTSFFETSWLEWLADLMGGAFALALTWLLFPSIISVVIGFLLERVIDAVDACYYAQLPAPRTRPLPEVIIQTSKFLFLMVFVNFLLLPFVFIFPLFPVIFFTVNGYLLGREYFELVALRRLSPSEARCLLKKKRSVIIAIGSFFTFLMTLPAVNLLTPIIATATMVHIIEDWRAHTGAGPKSV